MATASGYGVTAKFLHWLIFLLLAAQYAIGLTMPHIGRKTLDEGLVAWHFSVGAVILFFILIRLVWRLMRPVPLLAGMESWETRLSGITHWTLYALILVTTVLGWAATNARGWTVKLFGIVTLPQLAPKGSSWGHEAGDVHVVLIYVLMGLIGLHIAGALYHHFIKRDAVLGRMLFHAKS